VIQALISRSDRRLAPVIAAARGNHASLGGWKRAYRAVLNGEGIDPAAAALGLPPPPPWEEVVHGNWGEHQVLPWHHLQGPLPQATLWKHRSEAGLSA